MMGVCGFPDSNLDVTMDTSLHLLLIVMYLQYAVGPSSSCVKIFPDSDQPIAAEVGKEFSATCHLLEGSRYTTDDIEWLFENKSVPKQNYVKINETAVSVTVNISSNMNGWLKCRAAKESLSYEPSCLYGISLITGYPPLVPKNLTCIAVQEDKNISPKLKCSWDPGTRDPLLDTTYTLYAQLCSESEKHLTVIESFSTISKDRLASSCTVDLRTYPYHMDLRVWVEVNNMLGSEHSDKLLRDSSYFAKPSPPFDVRVLSEINFSTSLMVTWKPPLDPNVMELSCIIRYCQAGFSVWTEVPEDLMHSHTESFRLQSLHPYTDYVVQMQCIHIKHESYWSDWSANATERTAEAKPASSPDLWRIIQLTTHNRNITLIWTAPVQANGKILRYDLEISQDHEIFERRVVRLNELEHIRSHQTYSMDLPPGKVATIEITATNSAGVSPKATLFIPRTDKELPGVQDVSWSVNDGQLQVKWLPPPPGGPLVSQYLLEWMKIPLREFQSDTHWQRVSPHVNRTTLTGDFKPFQRYNISVFPIYSYRFRHSNTTHRYIEAGRPVTTAAYIQQGSPLEGPTSKVTKSKKTSAELTWEEIPLDSQRGFITGYTIFYKTGNIEKFLPVKAHLRSSVLTDLTSESEYVVHVMVSTVAGSKNGSDFNFKTAKYGDGEVELIVVVVCFSFLFFAVFIIMFCLRKREVIKELLWPHVPDPNDSSIAHWSPDFSVKTDLPKEDVSVVEVDVFDRKSLFEEDKAVLPLKKDKYLSEEHSSGIGGSSCMSSPRHSVSDSDEGDSGQTTASIVQYSAVVASGYKGQTPNHQTPVFARSESTQPLLDCEEHTEHLQEGNGQSRNSYFRRGRGLELAECEEPNGSSLTFCPAEEQMSPIVEDLPTSTSCYMPQQSGYRPQ
ncbi:interleukin-6 receptor subunit beta-like isoform X2 [Myxocyprinus asiaticus]|uniref:interleukin-6 receptor subunit beta-like isoform X2 n=1 Tax=Myxocyprinus asiaticus TaxID=70543 RepID=UPI002223703C|nr:interleukin-6 receptor subunit beta-like isoform X2 [Myxocyprinus asiaticus]